MILCMGILLILIGRIYAASLSASIDSFLMTGNLAGYAIDEFNDGNPSPWVVDDGTAIEQNGVLTLISPGDIDPAKIGDVYITQELSEAFIAGGRFHVADGNGDIVVTSTWTSGVPAENQYFLMESDIEAPNEVDLDEISIGLFHFGPDLKQVFDQVPPEGGLAVIFERNTGSDNTVVSSQSVGISAGDVNGNIVLTLSFDDQTNQFSASFSLDGGGTFQSPFVPVDTQIDQGNFNNWELTTASLNVIKTVNVGDYDIVTPIGSRWTYSYTYPSDQDDFTVSIARIDSGQYAGKMQRGDYVEYHPTDPQITSMIYELADDTFSMYAASGHVFDPPYVVSTDDLNQELACYTNCQVYAFQEFEPYPEAYMRIDDSVTVAAGTFEDVLVKFSIDQKKGLPSNAANTEYGLDQDEAPYAVTHIRWFAKGIGLVKAVDIDSATGSVVHSYELTSYQIPSDEPSLPDGWKTVSGLVTHGGSPVCAMVLANGQYMFTCKEGDDFGKYELDVPPDGQDQVTIQAFVSALAPFRQTTNESDLGIDIAMQPADPESQLPDVTTVNETDASTPANWARVTGTVTFRGESLCAMVLANGQYMFSCGANDGVYDLTVPLDGNGQITLYVFVSGKRPYKQVFAP